jgi:hypothetical protein
VVVLLVAVEVVVVVVEIVIPSVAAVVVAVAIVVGAVVFTPVLATRVLIPRFFQELMHGILKILLDYAYTINTWKH